MADNADATSSAIDGLNGCTCLDGGFLLLEGEGAQRARWLLGVIDCFGGGGAAVSGRVVGESSVV